MLSHSTREPTARPAESPSQSIRGQEAAEVSAGGAGLRRAGFLIRMLQGSAVFGLGPGLCAQADCTGFVSIFGTQTCVTGSERYGRACHSSPAQSIPARGARGPLSLCSGCVREAGLPPCGQQGRPPTHQAVLVASSRLGRLRGRRGQGRGPDGPSGAGCVCRAPRERSRDPRLTRPRPGRLVQGTPLRPASLFGTRQAGGSGPYHLPARGGLLSSL